MHRFDSLPRLVAIFATAVLLGAAGLATAQDYPAKPVRVIVPFPPGGGTDVLARVIGQKISDDWGQQFVVENRPGAAGLLGADVAANSPADGYTLLMTALGGMTPETIGSFAPVILVAAPPNVVVVNPAIKAVSMREFIALARSQPGKLNYGSSGAGSLSHLSGELLKSMAKIEIVHVPYKGMGQVLGDLLGNQIQFAIAPLAAVKPHLDTGKLKAIGVTGAKRYPPLPDVPTLAESGVPGYEAINWFGLFAPTGVARPIVDKLNAEVNKVLQLSDVKDRLVALGAYPVGGSEDDFGRYVRADTAKWAKVMKDAGIKLQ